MCLLSALTHRHSGRLRSFMADIVGTSGEHNELWGARCLRFSELF